MHKLLQVLIFFFLFFFPSPILLSNKSHKSLYVNAVFLEGGMDRRTWRDVIPPFFSCGVPAPGDLCPLSLPALQPPSLPTTPKTQGGQKGPQPLVHPLRGMSKDPQPLLLGFNVHMGLWWVCCPLMSFLPFDQGEHPLMSHLGWGCWRVYLWILLT